MLFGFEYIFVGKYLYDIFILSCLSYFYRMWKEFCV